MKKKSFKIILALLVYIGMNPVIVFGQSYKYVGAVKCKMCHNSEAAGQQFKKWSESAHANSMKTLASEKALDYAKKNNISDPVKETKCLNCHSTFGPATSDLIHEESEVDVSEGVSCESCHGPGSEYKTKSVMQDLTKSKENGLIIPDQKVCEKCHNNPDNPFNKPFNYEEAKKKIAHPKPKPE